MQPMAGSLRLSVVVTQRNTTWSLYSTTFEQIHEVTCKDFQDELDPRQGCSMFAIRVSSVVESVLFHKLHPSYRRLYSVVVVHKERLHVES